MINSAFSLAFNGSALLSNQNEMKWDRAIYQVTTSTDGHGSITASPRSGFSGTQVTLSNTPNANYGFQGYSVTGATLTGNKFTLNNDVTARATFSAVPHYTAQTFDSGTPFQGTTAFTGLYEAGDKYVYGFHEASKVSYTNDVRWEVLPPPQYTSVWVNTAVNLEFTGNIFALPYISGLEGSLVKYNDLYNMRNHMTTFNTNNSGVTAGYMKLNNTESAFITAVNIWVTGTTTDTVNRVCNFDNLKIKFNGQNLPTSAYMANEYACHLRTLNNGTVGKYILPNPIVVTSNNQKLTFYVTGTVPQRRHTISDITPWSANWYGYISGLEGA